MKRKSPNSKSSNVYSVEIEIKEIECNGRRDRNWFYPQKREDLIKMFQMNLHVTTVICVKIRRQMDDGSLDDLGRNWLQRKNRFSIYTSGNEESKTRLIREQINECA